MEKRLTRKQLIEHIRNTMPDNWSETEKSAFIECEVAKKIVFDEEYLWGQNVREKIEMYIEARKQAQASTQYYSELQQNEQLQTTSQEPPTKRRLICITMSELCVYVAKQFGLNMKYQKSNNKEEAIGDAAIFDLLDEYKADHLCPILDLQDGRTITVDIQQDLYKLQTRSRPLGFGTKDNLYVDGLDEEEIDAVFRKVYGLKEDEDFTDEYITNLNNQLSKEQLEPLQKIKKIIEDPRIQQEAQNLGAWGAKHFYKEIIQEVLGVPTFGTFFHNGTYAYITTCSMTNKQGAKKHSVFLYAQDYDEKICYIFSKKTRKMVPMTSQELQQMQAKSMTIRPATDSPTRVGTVIDKEIKSFIERGSNNDNSDRDITQNMEDIFTYEFEEDEK